MGGDRWRDGFAFAKPDARRKGTRKGAVLLVAVVWIGAGCTNIFPISDRGTAPSTPSRTVAATGTITVDSLALSFRLPSSFYVVEDHPDFLFLARSPSRRAIFSINPEPPSVIEHEARPGETLVPADIDGVDGVIVKDAFLERMPRDVATNELLVANGDRSFSAIFSAPEPELSGLWEHFIESVRIGSN